MQARWDAIRTGVLGLISMPLVVAGSAVISLDLPDQDAADSEFVAYFADNDGQIWLGAILAVAGIAALAAFVLGLARTLRRDQSVPGDRSGLVRGAGLALALFALVPPTVSAGVAGSQEFFEFTLTAEMAQLAIGVTWVPSIYAGIAASVVIAAASLTARRSGALPKAMVRAGFVLAPIVLVGAVPGFALPLFAIWAVAVGIVLIVRARREDGAQIIGAAPHARGRAKTAVAATLLLFALAPGATGCGGSDSDAEPAETPAFTPADLERLSFTPADVPDMEYQAEESGQGAFAADQQEEAKEEHDRSGLRLLQRLESLGLEAERVAKFFATSRDAGLGFAESITFVFADERGAERALADVRDAAARNIAPADEIPSSGLGDDAFGLRGQFDGYPSYSYGWRVGNVIVLTTAAPPNRRATGAEAASLTLAQRLAAKAEERGAG